MTLTEKGQKAIITSYLVLFSINPNMNQTKIERGLLLFNVDTSIFTLLYTQLRKDSKS